MLHKENIIENKTGFFAGKSRFETGNVTETERKLKKSAKF